MWLFFIILLKLSEIRIGFVFYIVKFYCLYFFLYSGKYLLVDRCMYFFLEYLIDVNCFMYFILKDYYVNVS